MINVTHQSRQFETVGGKNATEGKFSLNFE